MQPSMQALAWCTNILPWLIILPFWKILPLAQNLFGPGGKTARLRREKLAKMSTEFGLVINPDANVGDQLSVGERQRVEIIKALYRDAKILILDEPTAVLTPQEADDLFETLRSLTANGLAVIFISHKLHEILAISNRVAVLRRGAIVGEVETSKADRNLLAEMMVGEKVTRPKPRTMKHGAPVLKLSNISTKTTASGGHLKNINLTINAHQIIGIAGVSAMDKVIWLICCAASCSKKQAQLKLELGESLKNITASGYAQSRCWTNS